MWAGDVLSEAEAEAEVEAEETGVRTLLVETGSAPRFRARPWLVGCALAALALVLVLSSASRVTGSVSSVQEKVEVVRDEERSCSHQWASCRETKCCETPGTTCFAKDEKWAMCKPECVPGPDPVDSNGEHWSCKVLGPRKEGTFHGETGTAKKWVQAQCSDDGEGCAESRCCKQSGQQCFEKNETWAACKNICEAGVDPTDKDGKGTWSCKPLGGRTPGALNWNGYTKADWVADSCSEVGENCAHTRCCKGAGLQCVKRDDEHAECLGNCYPGPVYTDSSPKHWNCTPLGGRTPGRVPPPTADVWDKAQKNTWIKKNCSAAPLKSNNYTGENCIHTKCCKDAGKQCYSMNDEFGLCLNACLANNPRGPNTPLKDEHGKPWECKKLGQRFPHKWGSPSLFCFSVFRMYTYEGDIIKNQLHKQIGIFACDVASIFSQDPEVYVGDGRDGEVSTEHFDFAPVGVSEDGTAGNTALFMNVWEAVRWGGKYKLCDWTIKADPDAVVLAERMRTHVKWLPQGAFLNNCPKFSDSPLFGSVEVLSKGALDKYYSNEGVCRSMPYGAWGEDKWLTRCLSAEGAQSQMDSGMVGDALCMGQNCGDGRAAYHPFKNVGGWMNCWYAATPGQPLP